MSPIITSLGNSSAQGYGGLKSFAPETAFDSIATASGNGVSTITFSSIPQTYKSLQIRAIGKSSSASGGVGIRFNGITTTSYASHRLLGNGSTASAANATGNRMSDLLVFTDLSHSGYGVGIIDIIDYFSTSKNTTVRAFNGFDRNGAGEVYLSSALFNNTAAINSITIYDLNGTNWTTGTSFALYGVK